MPQGRGASKGGGRPQPPNGAGAEEQRAQMFVEKIEHLNCPLIGVDLDETTPGFISLTFQMGPRKFATFYVGRIEQKALKQIMEKVTPKGDIIVPKGVLPPTPEQAGG